jgi:2-keto-4-pentenoate hydratase/2-oxohepta-3-ene-1,7-dioic acid hydratase in catechol pathway
MKVVLFDTGEGPRYGLLTPGGVMSLETELEADEPQAMLERLIADFPTLQPRLAALDTRPIPLDTVRLLPPVPRPGKILVTTATYGPDAPEQKQQLLATLKSPESVVGPNGTVHLPEVDAGAWQLVPRAMLGLVIRGAAKSVTAADWRNAVFGYTCVIDVMARGDQQFGRDYWLAKADTLGPLGPCIVTADDVPDPAQLRVRSWQNGESAQDFRIVHASHSIPEQVEFATTVMTLHTGDVLACGTSAVGQRPVGDGDTIDVEIEPIGSLAVRVAAPVRSAA